MSGLLVLLLLGTAGILLFRWAGRRVEVWMNRIEGPIPGPASERALRIHGESLVVDLHADPLLWGRDLRERSRVGHVDLPRLREGGVTLQVFGLVTQVPLGTTIERSDPSRLDTITLLALAGAWPRPALRSCLARARYQAGRLHALADGASGAFCVIRTRQDLDALVATRRDGGSRVGGLLSVEGAQALDGEASNLVPLFEDGIRMIGLTHFFDNEFAGSAHGLAKGGLTAQGKTLVREMERSGVVVDLAHASVATIDDVLALATRPVVVSHTGVRATCDSNRNLSDDQIRGVARGGGLIGIGFWSDAVGSTHPADIARAARHVVELVGDDHVALGSDFNGAVATSFDVSRLSVVTQALLDTGLPEEAVRKALGENAVRVLRAVLP